MDDNYGIAAPFDPEDDGMDEALYIWGEGDASVLLDDELGYMANELQAGNVLMLLDACFSGTGTRGPDGQPKRLTQQVAAQASRLATGRYLSGSATSTPAAEILRDPQRHILLAASADDQLAWTARGWPRYGGVASVFTYYLASGLENAGATIGLPLAGGGPYLATEIEEFPTGPDGCPPAFAIRWVTPGYFETMRIPIVSGRGVEPMDH